MVKGKIKDKKKAGRKLFDGKNEKEVIPKLEQVWSIGGTDKEACFYAEISPPALCRYLQKHPAVSERKEALKQGPILKARREVVTGLTGNPEFALRYLERKLPDEFGLKQNQAISQTVVVVNGKNRYDKFSESELQAEFERRRRRFHLGNSEEVKE